MNEIQNLRKSFGQLEVLKGIDLHIAKGEVVSIVGPSGAGKTTLLQIAGTLARPDSGTLRIAGNDVRLGIGTLPLRAPRFRVPVPPTHAGVHRP